MSEMYFDSEARRAELERHRENSARIAEAFARMRSVGQGSIEFDERVDFNMTFVEEPYMSYGAYLDLDALEEQLDFDQSSGAPPMPICTGYVTDWDRDDRGFYVGAWVGVRVWYPYEANVWPQEPIEIMHHYSFKAIAIKDVPIEMETD